MNLKSLRNKVLALGLAAMAGQSWATVAPTEPADGNTTWQDVQSIQWSTNGGSTWGTSALAVGQSVTFQVTMHKTNLGNHYADLAKAWLDQNGDGVFTGSEAIIFGYNIVNGSETPWWNGERTANNQLINFTSGAISVTSAMVGDLWLLARVTCSETLANAGGVAGWNDQWDPANVYANTNGHTATGPLATNMSWYNSHFSSSANYSGGQGESQLAHLTVKNKVPEPGTLSLFAAAMVVGMGLRRKLSARV